MLIRSKKFTTPIRALLYNIKSNISIYFITHAYKSKHLIQDEVFTLVDLLGRLSRSRPNLERRTHDVHPPNVEWIGTTGSSNEVREEGSTPPSSPVCRLTSREAESLVASYLGGEQIKDLVGSYNIHRTTVMAYLRRAGVPLYSGWTPETTEEARRLYESGLTVAQVAERLERPASTVGRHLREAGVSMRPRGFQSGR